MRFFLFALAFIGFSQIVSAQQRSNFQSPNVIIIFMDDMGYGDIEPYGAQPYKTPNLNRLATEGMRFTQFYAAQAVCSASRSALMTGCYPTRIGIHGAFMPWANMALNPEEETIAELLKTKGYKTGMVGKWHLGQKVPFLPLQQGFDEFFGLPYSNDMWPVDFDGKPVAKTSNKYRYPPLPLIDGNKTVEIINTLEDQATLTEKYTKRALSFIEKNRKEKFFLYFAHSMTHVPLGAGKKFAGKSGYGLYADVVQEVDWSVGEIMRTLEKLNLRKNTLVIFTSDNGPWLSFGNHGGSNGGLREGKGTHWEGGVKVPCIMSFPGFIPSGSVTHALATTMDVLPTVAGLCKTNLPKRKIDGVNLLPVLKGIAEKSPRKEFVYYYERNNLKAIRNERWKIVFPCSYQTIRNNKIGRDGWPGQYSRDTTELALYDLMHDPGENYDVQTRYPEVVKELSEIADRYRKEIGDGLTKTIGKEVRPAAIVE